MLKQMMGIALVMALALGAGIATAGPVGSIYNPNDYTLGFGDLIVDSDKTLTIQTGFEAQGDSTDVWYSFDGGTNKIYGTVALNQNSTVEMAVFAFDSISIDNPDGIVVTGNRGLVLGSRGDLLFKGATLDVKGGNGTTGSGSAGGAGGPGAEGAARGAATDSDPPGDTAGNGGVGGNNNGRGSGAGAGQYRDNNAIGGSGGYGSSGGHTISNNPPVGGGIVYGDNLLVNLYGGSGGGGAYSQYQGQHDLNYASGGGGGGSLALIALGDLVIDGTLDAFGGNGGYANGGDNKRAWGGSGSGGGVLLAGGTVTFDDDAAINAYGGYHSGANNYAPAGGGRVAVYTGIFTAGWQLPNYTPDQWETLGFGESARTYTAVQLGALDGLTVVGGDNPVNVDSAYTATYNGTFYVLDYQYIPPVSEPASLGLLGLALLGLRKRRS
jgi:hypothetical protein